MPRNTTIAFLRQQPAKEERQDLRQLGFKGKTAAEIGDEEIKVIGARYNIGAGLSLEKIQQNTSYVKTIVRRKEQL